MTNYGDRQQLSDLAASIAEALRGLNDVSYGEERLGNRMRYLSFSFILDAKGAPMLLPYKLYGDVVQDKTHIMSVVSKLVKQIDTITTVGKGASLVMQLNRTPKPSAELIEEIDNLVMSIWVYDLVNIFTTSYSLNLKEAQTVLDEINREVITLSVEGQSEALPLMTTVSKQLQ
jgi:hypothetical protein